MLVCICPNPDSQARAYKLYYLADTICHPRTQSTHHHIRLLMQS